MPTPPLHDQFDCQTCGACCASFRVSFYWAEAEVRQLSFDLTEQLNATMICMAGTNCVSPRCTALEGDVGKRVTCRVYDKRPPPCHEVTMGDERCLTARARWGLTVPD